MRDEPSAGVTEHPLAAMLLLGVCACGAYLLHALPVSFGLDHGFFHHHGALRAATFLVVAAAVAFPVYVARPLLAVAMPVWGRAMVWTLYGAASLAAYGPELRHRPDVVGEMFVLRVQDGSVWHEITLLRDRDAVRVGPRELRLREGLRSRMMRHGVDGSCAVKDAGPALAPDGGVAGPDALPDPAADPEAFERAVRAQVERAAEEAARNAERQDGRCVVVFREHGPVHFTLPPDLPRN